MKVVDCAGGRQGMAWPIAAGAPRIKYGPRPYRASPSTGSGAESMVGAAGRAGRAERGDAEVEFERASRGLDVVVVPASPREGRTDGERLEAAARELLADLEVVAGRVTVRDHGAPEWVVRARLEAAVGRAGVGR